MTSISIILLVFLSCFVNGYLLIMINAHRLKTCFPLRTSEHNLTFYDCRRKQTPNGFDNKQRLVLSWFRNAVHGSIEGPPTDIAIMGYGLSIFKRSEPRLFLNRLRLRVLYARAFHGLFDLVELNLAHNKLSSLDPKLFSYTLNLEIINLYNNHLVSLDNALFNKLSKLTFLHLGKNRITQISASLFSQVGSLKSLILFENRIHTIEVNAFENLNKLESLDLNENQLKDYSCSLFRGLDALRLLNVERLAPKNGSPLRACIFCELPQILRNSHQCSRDEFSNEELFPIQTSSPILITKQILQISSASMRKRYNTKNVQTTLLKSYVSAALPSTPRMFTSSGTKAGEKSTQKMKIVEQIVNDSENALMSPMNDTLKKIFVKSATNVEITVKNNTISSVKAPNIVTKTSNMVEQSSATSIDNTTLLKPIRPQEKGNNEIENSDNTQSTLDATKSSENKFNPIFTGKSVLANKVSTLSPRMDAKLVSVRDESSLRAAINHRFVTTSSTPFFSATTAKSKASSELNLNVYKNTPFLNSKSESISSVTTATPTSFSQTTPTQKELQAESNVTSRSKKYAEKLRHAKSSHAATTTRMASQFHTLKQLSTIMSRSSIQNDSLTSGDKISSLIETHSKAKEKSMKQINDVAEGSSISVNQATKFDSKGQYVLLPEMLFYLLYCLVMLIGFTLFVLIVQRIFNNCYSRRQRVDLTC